MGATFRSLRRVGMAVGMLWPVLAWAQAPQQDTGFTTATPRPDPDTVIVRERSYGAEGIDLTSYGIGTGPVDFVQSLYFRFFVDNDGLEDATAGRVVLPPGAEVLGFIVDEFGLGGSVDDGVATETDAIFGIADPDDYSEASPGFGVGPGNAKDEFVCATAPNRFVFALNVDTGVDDFRAIIDYGDSFPQGWTFDVAHADLGTVGNVPVERGIQVGETDPPTTPGSGDFGELGSVLGIPLTAATQPQVAYDLPFLPLQSVYLIRDTAGPTRIDGYDVTEQFPAPGRAQLDVRVLTPAAMTDGADGRLHAVGAGFGYASIDPRDGSTTQLALQDHPGSNRDLTNLPGTRDLYVVRDTAGDTAIDRLDIDNPSFVPTFTIPAPTLPDPVAITDGADGLLYVLGATGGLVPVDPATGPLPKVAFGAPAGTYVSATGRDDADAIYLLRVAGSAATVDVFDIASGLVTFDLATIDPLADAVSITDAAGGRLVVVGAGDPPAPRYVELDAATGATLVSHYCLDFDGANVAVTNLVADLSATPGEAGTADRPLLVNDYDAGSGMLSIRYGVACEAVDHTLHYGPLTHADLAAYNYTGEDCGIGNTGSYDTFDPGAGSYFFFVVANDGLAEGSYGVSESGGMQSERPNNVINPGCPLPQDLTDSCAP